MVSISIQIDTINRLLKKQTPKLRGRGKAAGDATPADQANAEAALEGVDLPTMVRWTSNKDGIRLSNPDSWLKAPVGKIFEPQKETERMSAVRRKLIEEL
jgi:Ino eighty subunit 2